MVFSHQWFGCKLWKCWHFHGRGELRVFLLCHLSHSIILVFHYLLRNVYEILVDIFAFIIKLKVYLCDNVFFLVMMQNLNQIFKKWQLIGYRLVHFDLLFISCAKGKFDNSNKQCISFFHKWSFRFWIPLQQGRSFYHVQENQIQLELMIHSCLERNANTSDFTAIFSGWNSSHSEHQTGKQTQ